MLTAADLPDDIVALKALLLASERRFQERDDQVAGLEAHLPYVAWLSVAATICLRALTPAANVPPPSTR